MDIVVVNANLRQLARDTSRSGYAGYDGLVVKTTRGMSFRCHLVAEDQRRRGWKVDQSPPERWQRWRRIPFGWYKAYGAHLFIVRRRTFSKATNALMAKSRNPTYFSLSTSR